MKLYCLVKDCKSRRPRSGSGIKDNSNLDKYLKTTKKESNYMKKRVEFKISFKNGNVGYYTYLEDGTIDNQTEKEMIKNAEKDIKMALNFKAENMKSAMILTDCIDDKKTMIDVSEIVTIGYSLAEYSE